MLTAVHATYRQSTQLYVFFYEGTAPSEIYTLSLHDALPILPTCLAPRRINGLRSTFSDHFLSSIMVDRKSTRLNSSHVSISYAVFCLKKKKKAQQRLYDVGVGDLIVVPWSATLLDSELVEAQ